ncbi:LysE family translocator [Verrucomicrobia bacterium]|nr:LysE family translocator [Verrucomicrobiota bacterium]
MFVLSIIPGPSVFLVIVRSMTSNLSQGLVTIGGIVFANIIFILLVVYGVGALVASMDGLYVIIKFAGSAYLFWLGIKLLRTKVKKAEIEQVTESSWHANFTAGFIVTISAPRAILFYVSLLPNVIDLTKARAPDVLLLMLIATVAVGAAKLPYALLAYRSALFLQEEKPRRVMNILAGAVMILIGGVVALRA